MKKEPCRVISNKELVSSVDLTLLNKASEKDLKQLEQRAIQSQVAAVCVYPQDLTQFNNLGEIKLATVVNFPNGNSKLEDTFELIQLAVQNGAVEIDYVFPYSSYLQGFEKFSLSESEQILNFCQSQHLTSKVILETSQFLDQHQLYRLCRKLIDQGCQFLKTSTGKTPVGANLKSVRVLLKALKDSSQSSCGLKVSGGIKTREQAISFAQLAENFIEKRIDPSWFRIGASSLLDELDN